MPACLVTGPMSAATFTHRASIRKDNTVKSSKAPRRKQEDRSAATRARLLDAAIASLYTRGYAATTTMIVCEESGVSRGAMLHQFPSKVDLMLYVVRAVYDQEIALYEAELDGIDDPRERMLAFPRVAWQVPSRRSPIELPAMATLRWPSAGADASPRWTRSTAATRSF